MTVTRTTLSERIRVARAVSRLTQAELAKRLGVSRQTLGLWESGERTPIPALQGIVEAWLSSLE